MEWAFIHAGGDESISAILGPRRNLPARGTTGCIVRFSSRALILTIQFVGKIKSGAVFGGEGLFFATTTRARAASGCNRFPFSRMANRIIAAAPKAGGSRTAKRDPFSVD